MIKYTIPYKTISEVGCVVNVDVPAYIGEPIELVAGSDPFVVEYDNADLLSPMRMSSATIQVFGSDYLRDIYTSEPMGVRVHHATNGVIDWVGYMTPDTFSQNYSNPSFTYEIECVCSLSYLKHKKYDIEEDIASFWDIIYRAKTLAGYTHAYLTKSIQTVGGLNAYQLCQVSSANFYDELGEAMTYYEILENIAKYFGCTFTVYEQSIYFLDYYAIVNGFNTYYKYTTSTPTTVTLSDVRAISGEDYMGTGATISRLSGKNKITVNCSRYEMENIFPDIEKGLRARINKSVISWKADRKDAIRNYLVTVDAYYSGDHDDVEVYNYGLFSNGSSLTKATRYVEGSEPNKLWLDTELRVRYYLDQAAHDRGDYLTTNDPILRMKSSGKIFIHNSVYFSFSADIQANMEATTHTSQDGLIMDEAWNSATVDTVWPIPLKLRIGEYYYNGSSWAKTESKFNAYLEIKKDEKKFGRFIPIRDDNTYTLGIGDLSGCIINPPPTTIYGEMELTMYAPRPIDFDVAASHDYGVKWVFIKNIKMDYAIQDLEGIYDFDEKKKEDTLYESTIDANYIEEADEIDLKICTNTDQKLALSSVMVEGEFLEALSIQSLSYIGVPEEGLVLRALSLYNRPRFSINPTLLNNLKPYSSLADPNLVGAKFVVAGQTEDKKMESATYNLIEI